MSQATPEPRATARRTILRLGALGGAGLAFGAVQGVIRPRLGGVGLLSPDGAFAATVDRDLANQLYIEVFPTSPLILTPFTRRAAGPEGAGAGAARASTRAWKKPPGPGRGQQNSLGNQQHQIWPSQVGYPGPDRLQDRPAGPDARVHDVAGAADRHERPADRVVRRGGQHLRRPATLRTLPPSTIYGFNGTFPGPMINAEYGKPALVRFENHLDENPLNLDRQDFGSPDLSFLTHLHNGHTAPESDGNPHYSMKFGPKPQGYRPGMSVDNLYLNWPAGGDDREKQSFFWFHDHRMDHTGSNVYKGMVGLYPIYDPKNGLDMGDERQGLRLPGRPHRPRRRHLRRRLRHPAGVLRLPPRRRRHRAQGRARLAISPRRGNPRTHPEWWGKTFFKHMPQPRLRGRHLHRQRHRVPGAGGQAAQVPLPVPGRLDLADLRLPADELDAGPEGGE